MRNCNTALCIGKLLPIVSRSQGMKAICHQWSRGRHVSPSLPGDRYQKLSSQKQSPGRNFGEHRLVRRSGTASSGTAPLYFSLRMRRCPITDYLTTWWES